MAGQNLWLTCRIPRHPDHRSMAYGLVCADCDVSPDSEGREVHGEAGPVTFQRLIQRVNCDITGVFCVVRDVYGQDEHATAHLEVAGCSEAPAR